MIRPLVELLLFDTGLLLTRRLFYHLGGSLPLPGKELVEHLSAANLPLGQAMLVDWLELLVVPQDFVEVRFLDKVAPRHFLSGFGRLVFVVGMVDDRLSLAPFVLDNPLGIHLRVTFELLQNVYLLVEDGYVDFEVAVGREIQGFV